MTDITPAAPYPVWVVRLLKYAGYYNLAWGVYILSRPFDFYRAFNPQTQAFPVYLYLLGVFVLGMGLVYLWTAHRPLQYWFLAAFGFFTKLVGPLGSYLLFLGPHPNWFNFGLSVVFNDLLWVAPLGLAAYSLFKAWQNTEAGIPRPFPDIMVDYHTQKGENLADLQAQKPVLLVFLRHFGCTFCRETLATLQSQKSTLEQKGTQLVLVHMASEAEASAYFQQYGLGEVSHLSDPACGLYRAFSLSRATFWQVFGPRVWRRGWQAGIRQGHGVGQLVGDGFRMPGVFLVYQNQLLQAYRHQSVADVPDYEALAHCALPSTPQAKS
ncbi:MAG: hypothetical protein OHK0053_11830 [Microscillaceae bacterium]